MGFIREKKIKNGMYAYLVENKWTSKGPRQKVTRYIGKTIVGAERSAHPFPTLDIGRMSYTDALRSVLVWNLETLGFTADGNLYKNGDIIVDTLTFVVKDARGKDAIMKVKVKNDTGYLCTVTLQKLFNFTMAGIEEKVGYEFARVFVDAGLDVPKDVFVRIFEKVFTPA